MLTAADMAAYHPIWAEPLHITYRGYDIYSNPATSRGGFELEMALNLVEPYDLAKLGAGSPEALHLLIEAIKLSKSDIYHYVADPKFTKIPVAGLLSKSYADDSPQADRTRQSHDVSGMGRASGRRKVDRVVSSSSRCARVPRRL